MKKLFLISFVRTCIGDFYNIIVTHIGEPVNQQVY